MLVPDVDLSLLRGVVALAGMRPESQTPLYLARLVAFVLIIVAIADKNRTVRRQTDRDRGPRRAA